MWLYVGNVYGKTQKSSGWTLVGEMGFQLKHQPLIKRERREEGKRKKEGRGERKKVSNDNIKMLKGYFLVV